VINQSRNGRYSTFDIIAITAIVVCIVIICLMGAAIFYLMNNQQPAQAVQQNTVVTPCPTCASYADQGVEKAILSTAPPATPPTSTAPPDFKNIKNFNGSGSQSTEMFDLNTGTIKIKWKNTGDGNFIVQLINARDGSVEHIANENGNTEGETIFFHEKINRYIFDVTSNGIWNIYVDWMP